MYKKVVVLVRKPGSTKPDLHWQILSSSMFTKAIKDHKLDFPFVLFIEEDFCVVYYPSANIDSVLDAGADLELLHAEALFLVRQILNLESFDLTIRVSLFEFTRLCSLRVTCCNPFDAIIRSYFVS